MESFSCSPFSLGRKDVKSFPDNLPDILCFIYHLNYISAVVQSQYCLNYNAPIPYPKIISNGNSIMPLSGYCCYNSTLVCKHFLGKFYPELENIIVVDGIYKGLGEHSWLELDWKGKHYILDTKPYFQGYPNMYNFGTPEVKKYRKKFFRSLWFSWEFNKPEEYKWREELANWCIYLLTRLEFSPINKMNMRRAKRYYIFFQERVNELKREYNLTHENKLEIKPIDRNV